MRRFKLIFPTHIKARTSVFDKSRLTNPIQANHALFVSREKQRKQRNTTKKFKRKNGSNFETRTTIADQQKLDKVIIIGSSPRWWSSHYRTYFSLSITLNDHVCLSMQKTKHLHINLKYQKRKTNKTP